MFLFKDKSLNVKVVKDPRVSSDVSFENRNIFVGVEIAAGYADIVKDVVTHTALVIGSVWCVCKIVERVCR